MNFLRKHCSNLIIVFCLVFVGFSCKDHHINAQPVVELTLDPDIRTIPLQETPPKEIALIARTNKQNLTFTWELDGVGKLDGDLSNPGIFYLVPDRIDGLSAKAIIRVTVRDKQDRQAGSDVTLTLVASTPTRGVNIEILYRSNSWASSRNLTPGSVLNSGDWFRIIVTPKEDVYVYIFQIDSSDQLYRLFPGNHAQDRTANLSNPMRHDVTYYIPRKNQEGQPGWFVLDAHPGREEIYVLTSLQPYDVLEQQEEHKIQKTHVLDYTETLRKYCEACVYMLTFDHQ